MVIVCKEELAKLVARGSKNVAAFTLGKTKKLIDNDIQIDYTKLNFLPDDEDVNAILEGDISANKYIKKAQKELWNPAGDHSEISLGMVMLVNMLAVRHKKGEPNILLFVEDEKNPERNKFLVKYITAMFNTFGIEPLTKSKTIYKLFKKSKKAVKRVIDFINSDNRFNVNKSGTILMKLNRAYFGIELRQAGMRGLGASDLSKKTTKTLMRALENVYTNQNLKYIDEIGFKDKVTNKYCKKLRKKNKLSVEAYESFSDIVTGINADVKLPKVKFGSDKKNHKPKMNIKKFEKYFMKKNNRAMLIMIYTHTVAVTQGLDVGANEYNKYMSDTCTMIAGDEFGKKYVSVAKDYAKAKAAIPQNITR